MEIRYKLKTYIIKKGHMEFIPELSTDTTKKWKQRKLTEKLVNMTYLKSDWTISSEVYSDNDAMEVEVYWYFHSSIGDDYMLSKNILIEEVEEGWKQWNEEMVVLGKVIKHEGED